MARVLHVIAVLIMQFLGCTLFPASYIKIFSSSLYFHTLKLFCLVSQIKFYTRTKQDRVSRSVLYDTDVSTISFK